MTPKKMNDPATNEVVQNPSAKEEVLSYLNARRRPQRPPTGLRASGFREGFARGAVDVLREIWPSLDDTARSRAAEIAARYRRPLHDRQRRPHCGLVPTSSTAWNVGSPASSPSLTTEILPCSRCGPFRPTSPPSCTPPCDCSSIPRPRQRKDNGPGPSQPFGTTSRSGRSSVIASVSAAGSSRTGSARSCSTRSTGRCARTSPVLPIDRHPQLRISARCDQAGTCAYQGRRMGNTRNADLRASRDGGQFAQPPRGHEIRAIRILLMPDIDGVIEDSDWEFIEDEARNSNRRPGLRRLSP